MKTRPGSAARCAASAVTLAVLAFFLTRLLAGPGNDPLAQDPQRREADAVAQ